MRQQSDQVYGRRAWSDRDLERLRLLEAVAEAMRPLLDAGYGQGTEHSDDHYAYEERLLEALDTGTVALAALEAHDE